MERHTTADKRAAESLKPCHQHSLYLHRKRGYESEAGRYAADLPTFGHGKLSAEMLAPPPYREESDGAAGWEDHTDRPELPNTEGKPNHQPAAARPGLTIHCAHPESDHAQCSHGSA